MNFDKCVHPHDHFNNHDIEHSHHSEIRLCPFAGSSLPWPQATPICRLSLQVSFAYSRTSYKWNRAVRTLLYLFFFFNKSVCFWDSFVLLCVSVVSSFLLPSSIPLYERTIICSSTLLWLDIRVVSSLGVIWIARKAVTLFWIMKKVERVNPNLSQAYNSELSN